MLCQLPRILPRDNCTGFKPEDPISSLSLLRCLLITSTARECQRTYHQRVLLNWFISFSLGTMSFPDPDPVTSASSFVCSMHKHPSPVHIDALVSCPSPWHSQHS